MNKKGVIGLIAVFALGFLIGFIFGFEAGIQVVIKKGVEVARIFTNISINEDLMRDAIFSYEHHISGLR